LSHVRIFLLFSLSTVHTVVLYRCITRLAVSDFGKAPQTGELLVKSANDRELSAPSEISISGANIANRVEGSEGSAS